MRFAIFTHVAHKPRDEDYFAYGPYVRELNLWLQTVEQVEVVAPVSELPLSPSEVPYQAKRLRFTRIPEVEFTSLSSIFKSSLRLPKIIFATLRAMGRAEHLHLRCPGNIGLIAAICQIFFPGKVKSAKYAGNWDPEAEQPWTYKLQRWILSNTFLTKNMQVLVYGEWPGVSTNVIPFFTASFSEEEKALIPKKEFCAPWKFLFVGSLVKGKRPLEAIQLIQCLEKKGFEVSLKLYGEGPEREGLEAYVQENKLQEFISFEGNQPLEVLKEAYRSSHFVVLLSRSEGWPKALAEGMFFGCVPIATDVSCVPWMLGGGNRGIILTAEGDVLPRVGTRFIVFSHSEELTTKGTERGTEDTKKNSEFRIQNAELREALPQVGTRFIAFGRGENLTTEDTERGTESTEFFEGEKRRLGEWGALTTQYSLLNTLEELLKQPEELKRISEEAKRWSQEYTLERFEKGIQEVLKGGRR